MWLSLLAVPLSRNRFRWTASLKPFTGIRRKMLIVVSEYGSTQGIVTLRDVVDELFPPP